MISRTLLCAFILAVGTSIFAAPASAQPTVVPFDNGDVSVDMKGCSVLFNPRGEIVTKGRDCNGRQVQRAREAFATYQREQGASDHGSGYADDEGDHSGGSSYGGYADSYAGGPDYWIVTGVPDDDLSLREEPSSQARIVAFHVRNGTSVRNLGCEPYGNETWCRVEYRATRGWTRQRWLREGGNGSSYGDGSSSSGGSSYGDSDEVILYRDSDYRGTSDAISDDIRDLRDSRIGTDSLSSIRIPSGCRVTVFEDDGFRGRSIDLYSDVPDFGRTDLGHDQASSIRVDCR